MPAHNHERRLRWPWNYIAKTVPKLAPRTDMQSVQNIGIAMHRISLRAYLANSRPPYKWGTRGFASASRLPNRRNRCAPRLRCCPNLIKLCAHKPMICTQWRTGPAFHKAQEFQTNLTPMTTSNNASWECMMSRPWTPTIFLDPLAPSVPKEPPQSMTFQHLHMQHLLGCFPHS